MQTSDIYCGLDLVLAPVFPIGEKVAIFSRVGIAASQDDDKVHKGSFVVGSQVFRACGLRCWVGWGPGCFPGLNFGMLGRAIGEKVAIFSRVGIAASQDDDKVHKGSFVVGSQVFRACGLRCWVGWGPGCFPGLNFGMLGRAIGGGGIICRHGWRFFLSRGRVLVKRRQVWLDCGYVVEIVETDVLLGTWERIRRLVIYLNVGQIGRGEEGR